MAKRLAVVVSQSPSKNPAKRKLEEDIVTGLLFEPGIDVTIVPNLYDIQSDSTGMLALKSIGGNMVVCSWLFERAAHWVLDRNEIGGQVGPTLLVNEDDDDDEELDEGEQDEAEKAKDDKVRVVEARQIPNRKIYCLDLRVSNKAKDFIEEVKRIRDTNLVKLVTLGDIVGSTPAPLMNGKNGSGGPDLSKAATRFENPTNDTALAADGNGIDQDLAKTVSELGDPTINRIESSAGRRWYPVIDYSRCTNCMECIDFCLFGVYGVDKVDTILVEQPDNCRKGCPACSRVCPENAIMFPQHKTPAIAGSSEGVASMKIDLSQLFGAPAEGKSAVDIAALERDEQLIATGRDAVGLSVGIAKRQIDRDDEPKDALDDLVDELNDFDL